MNGVDRTNFNRAAAAPYKGRQVLWHGQPGSFRDDVQGNLVWTPSSGANLGSIEDITGKLGVSTGQGGGMQYQYDPATGGVTSTGLAPPPLPPPPLASGAEQGPSGPGQQGQPPGPSFPSEEAKNQHAMFSAAFGSSQGDPNFNVNFDFNQDGIINQADNILLAQSFAPPPPVDPIDQQINSHVESMISTLGDQSTITGIRYGQAPSEQYYQQHLDGYKTYLKGLSDDQRNKVFAAPHKSYRDYVIDQLDATPELGNILRGKWTGENVNAVAQSIASGQGILNLEYLDSIPEELLSRNKKEHIKGVVNTILNPSLTKPVPPVLAAGDLSGLATDPDVVGGDVVSEDDLSFITDSIAFQMRTSDGSRLGDDYYRNLLTGEGYTPDQIERIIKDSRSIATGLGLLPSTPVDDPPVDDRVDGGIPPGWVDADNDGFDDNTNLDIDGNPKPDTWLDVDGDGYDDITGLDRQGYPKDKTQTQPKFPDTDDNIQNILTYLQETLTQTEGIDNIAVKELADFSRSSKRAQEQLLEDLNRLGLVGLESGDAQAALGEFAAGVLAEKRQIRADSDARIRDNIDKLIEVAGLEVTAAGQEERIKMLQDSIESRDQLALFNGLMAILGPEGLDLLSGLPGAVVDAVKKGKDLWDKIREGSDDAALAAILASEAYKRLRKQGLTEKEAIDAIQKATPEELAEWEKEPVEPVVEPSPEEPTQYDPTTDPRWEEYGNPPAGSAGEFAQQFDWDNASDEALNPSFGVYGDPEAKIFLENLAGPGGSLTPTEVVEALALGTITENTAIAYFRNHPDFDVDQNNNIGVRKGNGWKGKFLNFATVVLTRAGNDVILNGQKHKSQTGEAKGSYSFGISEEDL